MKVCILSDLNSYEGIGVYAQEIYQRLRTTFDLDYLYLDFPNRSMVKDPNGKNIVFLKLKPLPFESKPLFWLRIKKHLPVYDLYHIASQNLAFMGKSRNFVQTVHDLIPLFISGSPWQKAGRKWLFSGIPYAKHIMADSAHTQQDITKVFKVPSEKMTVVSLGVSEKFRPLDKEASRKHFNFASQQKYILHIGIDKWRKNVKGALQALSKLRQRVPEAVLVRVGKNSEQTERSIARLGLTAAVLNYSHINQEELVTMYNACDVLLFPSYYEGFGLPVLEAMACGLPVIASSKTSVPEVTGDCAELVDPDDIELIAKKLELILSNFSVSQNLRERGLARAKSFGWEETAKAVAKVYGQAI